MDILTQGLLGAATFSLIKDKELGKKSLVIGALAGIAPDLDMVLSPFFNDVEFLTVHRSMSHSVIICLTLSSVLGYGFYRYYDRSQSLTSWVLAFGLTICTHPLLDWFTTYGTQLFSPLSNHLFSLNSIHVFEPIYTFILLTGVLLLALRPTKGAFRSKIALTTVMVSTLYLGSTYASKSHAFYHFRSELERQELEFEKVLVSPTPLNSLLWHGIIKTVDGYYFGTYSILDKRMDIEFHFVESANEILPKLSKSSLVQRYLEYTQDFPLVRKDEDGMVKIYAVKYGPINYFGKPEFVYPLCVNIDKPSDKEVKIEYDGKQRGPVKNYKNLLRRVKGI